MTDLDSSSPKAIAKFAFPILVSSCSSTAMGFVDMLFIGRLGVDKVAAVGLANTFLMTLTYFFIGSLGTTRIFSARFSAQADEGELRSTFGSATLVALLAYLVIILPLALLLPSRAGTFGLAPGVQDGLVIYLGTRLPGLVFTFLNLGISSFITGLGEAKSVARIALFGNCLNAVLDYFLILGNAGFPALGLQGSAIATVMAEGISTAFYVYVMQRQIPRKVKCSCLRACDYFNPGSMKQLVRFLSITTPKGFQYLIEILSYFTFTLIIKSVGTVALATNSIVLQLLMVLGLISGAIGRAGSVFIGRALGKGDHSSAYGSFTSTLKLGLWFNFGTVLIFLTLNTRLVRIFTADVSVSTLFFANILLLLAFNFFDSFQIIISNLLSGAGDTKRPALYALCCFYGIQIPAAYLLAIHMGLGFSGAWVGYSIAVFLLAALLFSRGIRRQWLANKF